MSIHISQVFEFLEQYPVCQYEGDIPSLLEMLCDVYMFYNPVENKEIREQLRNLEWILNKLSVEDREALFQTARDLCQKYEKAAFSHGVVVGMNLMTEVNYLP